MPVSSHLPARGGSPPNPAARTLSRFPVTSPRGEDHGHLWLVPEVDGFPVTSPRGEDQFGCAFNDGSKTFPVTSPRGEDLLPAPTTLAIIQVSSHPPPPPRGGSASALWGGYQTRCFQSPPREGRIAHAWAVKAHKLRFQSPPREGRIGDAALRLATVIVSSHLPARGGSRNCCSASSPTRWFPVTSPRGEDLRRLVPCSMT